MAWEIGCLLEQGLVVSGHTTEDSDSPSASPSRVMGQSHAGAAQANTAPMS